MGLFNRYMIVFLLLGSSALAEDAPPTVTLTQGELQLLISAESSKAVMAYINQQEFAKAKVVYDKVNTAFAPQGAKAP